LRPCYSTIIVRVIVAMSGGVDSGVAAARLHDEGHEVVGVTLHLWDYPEAEDGKGAHGRCCAPEDQYDARRTADALGFRHFTFDRRALFEEQVVTPFVAAYVAGVTPSPCSACNRTVKLRELLGLAARLDADAIATGHYARVVRDEDGRAFLAEGKDKHKDQSYFLYATPDALVRKLLFPLGESHKEEVRAEALRRKLPGATKGESQELCFVGQGAHAYADFVGARKGKVRPGLILDGAGRTVGEHEGIHRFTIGQRKGLGVALGKPAFVTRIDAARGEVHLGDAASLDAQSCSLVDVHLAAGVALPLTARVRVRYRHEGAMARIFEEAGRTRVVFDAPVRALTRGQVAVFYDRDRVLGGGTIGDVDMRAASDTRETAATPETAS
jgi:tRNA-specific 2-thiouridylase